MAIKSGFFNRLRTTTDEGTTYDREYYAMDFANYLSKVVGNGVFATPSNNLQIVESNGLEVIVKAGEGRIDGYWINNDTDFTLSIETADVILNRMDRIVMQLNHSERKIDIVYKVGELATEPVAPALIRNEEIKEYSLARIYVKAKATSISQSNIIDTRPLEDECGLIATMGVMESNNYFIQMQDFIDNFVEAKGTEYNAWFEGIKDTVKATSLYREYQAVYRNSVAGEQVITIPTSINYVHNGLDTLNVCINGMRLIKDTQYTINSDGLSITLTNPLEVALQDVEFINKKSIDGTGAESLIVQVEALNEKVDSVVNTQYVATGANDNINLSNIVKNFLDGTGNYSGVADNASLKIDVIGSLAIGDLIDGQMVFDLHNSVSSNRRVMIDFGNATIPEYVSANNINIFAVFASEENVIIENANIKVGNLNATTIYGFHGGIATNCKINIDNQNATTIYGIYAAKKSMFNDINLNKGISILATTGQLLIGNIVNQNTSISGATEVATIRI